jgi:phage terminase large subunit-like protein
METAFHLTGIYPEWWQGRRFATPVKSWVGGPDNEHVRDNACRILLGEAENRGTGTVPAWAILSIESGRGIAKSVDYFTVKHVTGGTSYCNFKSYKSEEDSWSGATLHFVWFDEEPPYEIYSEGLTRTNAGDSGSPGFAYMTLTPLLGPTEVARLFHPRPVDGNKALVRMGLRDALHYSDKDIPAIIAATPKHERKARIEGLPQLGEGAIFPFEEDEYVVEGFNPDNKPGWWLDIAGIDFGFNHPCGAVHTIWDRDTDIIFVTKEFREREMLTPNVASALRKWGKWLPWAWPHDGHIRDKYVGKTVAAQYRDEGLNMLPIHAQFEDGGMSTEAGVDELVNRIATRRLKVFQRCTKLRDEMQTYHRKKGLIVKEGEDLICAMRNAVIMRRFASSGAPEQYPTHVGMDEDPFDA